MKEIVSEALEFSQLKLAENYFQLKPWVYGSVKTIDIINMWIDLSREMSDSATSDSKIIFNMVSE